jgi:5-methylcytosine-specific restriction endonuclease McrA
MVYLKPRRNTTLKMSTFKRGAIPKRLQLQVFRRDGWICRWCGRPVVFAPAMKYLRDFARTNGSSAAIAYHDNHWTRRNAPLLDELGAVIDHVEAHSRGGPGSLDNLATSCNKCNAKKSSDLHADFSKKSPRPVVKGKYGEPEHWDGLSALFVVLVERSLHTASASERDWFACLRPPARPMPGLLQGDSQR